MSPEDYDEILENLVVIALDVLDEHGLQYQRSGKLDAICLSQPHCSKKEIMFTVFIFAMAICKSRRIPFIWSSDSDSWIFPETLARVISGIAEDDSFGGSCAQLEIHNGDSTLVAYLAAAAYWSEIHLMSGFLSAFDAIDCMPGPCALFRREALEEILLEWYDQCLFGQRPVCNPKQTLKAPLM